MLIHIVPISSALHFFLCIFLYGVMFILPEGLLLTFLVL